MRGRGRQRCSLGRTDLGKDSSNESSDLEIVDDSTLEQSTASSTASSSKPTQSDKPPKDASVPKSVPVLRLTDFDAKLVNDSHIAYDYDDSDDDSESSSVPSIELEGKLLIRSIKKKSPKRRKRNFTSMMDVDNEEKKEMVTSDQSNTALKKRKRESKSKKKKTKKGPSTTSTQSTSRIAKKKRRSKSELSQCESSSKPKKKAPSKKKKDGSDSTQKYVPQRTIVQLDGCEYGEICMLVSGLYECQVCHKTVKSSSGIRAHYHRCHNPYHLPAECEVCRYSNTSYKNIDIHKASKHSNLEWPFICEYRGEKIASGANSSSGSSNKSKSKKKGKPKACGMKFKTASEWRKHFAPHHGFVFANAKWHSIQQVIDFNANGRIVAGMDEDSFVDSNGLRPDHTSTHQIVINSDTNTNLNSVGIPQNLDHLTETQKQLLREEEEIMSFFTCLDDLYS